jgi:hypothetical protein
MNKNVKSEPDEHHAVLVVNVVVCHAVVDHEVFAAEAFEVVQQAASVVPVLKIRGTNVN